MPSHLQSASERRKLELFLDSLFRASSEADIAKHLQELPVPPPYKLRMRVLYASEPRADIASALVASERIRALGDSGVAFRLKPGAAEPESRPLPFALLRQEEDDILVAVAVATTEQWVALKRALKYLYPKLVPVFLSQTELIRAVRALRAGQPGFDLRVKELSARESLSRRGGLRRARSIREWTDEDLDEVLLQIADRRQTLLSLRMAFHKRLEDAVDVSPATLCKVFKNGVVEVTGGYALAWSTVVRHIASVGQQKLRFYSKRGLRERQYKPAPLEIRFSAPVFENVEEVRRLVTQLARYPHSMHAVQHGNPYAHVRLSDRLDGSAFDVWAVTNESLVVVPRLKATAAAIERLVHYVFDSFREGEVSDFVSQ